MFADVKYNNLVISNFVIHVFLLSKEINNQGLFFFLPLKVKLLQSVAQ